MWWAYTRGGLYSGEAYSRRFTVYIKLFLTFVNSLIHFNSSLYFYDQFNAKMSRSIRRQVSQQLQYSFKFAEGISQEAK
jgi:hypothetical protein